MSEYEMGKKSSKLFDRRRRKVFPRRLLVVNSWYWASICKGKYIAETVWKKTSYSLSKPFSLVANSSVVIIFYFIWATFLSTMLRSSVLRRTCISNCVFPLFPRKLSTIFCLVYSLPCDLEIWSTLNLQWQEHLTLVGHLSFPSPQVSKNAFVQL